MTNFDLFGSAAESAAPTTSASMPNSRPEASPNRTITQGSAASATSGIPTSSAICVPPVKGSSIEWREFIAGVRFMVEEIPEAERPRNSSLRFHIVAEFDGREVWRDGRRLVAQGSLRPFSYQLDEMLRNLNECAMCREQAFGAAGPSHRGSVTCIGGSLASGGDRLHCDCVACFGEKRR